MAEKKKKRPTPAKRQKSTRTRAKASVQDGAEQPVPGGSSVEAATGAPAARKRSRSKSPTASADTLLIVESPAKAKTLEKYLKGTVSVIASKGHLKDLPKRGGVDVEKGFRESYEVIKDKGKEAVLQSIRQQARRACRILLATDPDREGEAIAWHIKEEIVKGGSKAEIRRVLMNEITEKGVRESVANPIDLDPNLYEAQRTRRVLDRIGGYPLSNLLWKKLVFGLSAGRVQTPALRILVDQQALIDAFEPRPYWSIEAHLTGSRRPAFNALLDTVDGERLPKIGSRPAAESESDAQRFSSDLAAASYRVSRIVKRERSSRSPVPYITSKLQQDAANRLGMQPSRTMRVAQALYEGIALGKGKKAETVGLITYMRTDSVRLSNEAVQQCRQYIASTYGHEALPDKPNRFKSKSKGVQDAHEAIRPTRMDLPPDAVRNYLTDERFKLYKLIWDRFVACQMIPALYDQTSVEIDAQAGERRYGLRASGSILRVPGWKTIYGASAAAPLAGEEGEQPDDEDRTLPELEENERLQLQQPGVVVEAKQTEPPPYFTEASLVKRLDEEGIGRPSTYAEILSKVLARDYVHKVQNKLVPTELGRLVIKRLVEGEFDLADLDFTRKLEEDLDAIAEARSKRIDVLTHFHERLQEKIANSLAEQSKWWPAPEPLDENCPECGTRLVKRWGRNGLFIGCEGYPECKYTRSYRTDTAEPERQAELTDYICELCGAPMMKRWGRNGWFLGCSTFPKCKNTRSLPLGVKCPECGGDLIEIRTRGRKRSFFGCSNYATETKCQFRLWQRPVPERCPRCNAPFLVSAGSGRRALLLCKKEGCGYRREQSEASVNESTTESKPEGFPSSGGRAEQQSTS